MLSHLSFALAFASFIFPIGITATPTGGIGLDARASDAYLPPKTFGDGSKNVFYPCPFDSTGVAKCPFRCYSAEGDLINKCFDADAAKANIAKGDICLACEVPAEPESEVPHCQPVATYFKGQAPSRYGQFAVKEYPQCKWTCAEAQVPFSLCSKTNDTGMYELCDKTEPFCSTPRLVFKNLKPTKLSLTSGSCKDDAQYGKPAAVACPYRCTDDGSPLTYCSLNDKTGDFTKCKAC